MSVRAKDCMENDQTIKVRREDRPGDCGMKADLDRGPELSKADLGIAAAFFVAALALRIPFRSQLAYHWDSAQLALAVVHYDIRINQPHPPGFYLYIALGRLLNALVGDPHAALVWLSVLAGAWLTMVGWLLATSMFGRRCGLGTGLILLTSPLSWFHSEIALTTIVDSALVVTFVFACWRAVQQGATWSRIVVMAALLAAVAGVRQQSAPSLIPVWLYVLWRSARPRGYKLVSAAALLLGFSLLWFVPTVKSAGGIASYFHLLRLKSQIDASRFVWAGGGAEALASTVHCVGSACLTGLSVAGIIALTEFVCRALRGSPDDSSRKNRTQFEVLLLWLMSMLLLDMLMYVAMPGHILDFLPALVVLTSLGLIKFTERLATSEAGRTWAFGCVLIVVITVNTVVFVWSPRWTTRLLPGLTLSGVEIRDHDTELAACFREIRGHWPPGDVIICHRLENWYWGFTQFAYYLPEYRNVLLPPQATTPGTAGTRAWIGYQHKTAFESEFKIADGEQVVLVVPPDESIDLFQSNFDLRRAALLTNHSSLKLYVLHRRE
jgi:hypothetical protein